jgi:hypothetical protein
LFRFDENNKYSNSPLQPIGINILEEQAKTRKEEMRRGKEENKPI